jgi:AraC-like DNA-binding protein
MIHNSGYRWEVDTEAGFNDLENYFSVNCCGYEKYITKDVGTFREKGRLDYQLIYLVEGTGCFRINGDMTEVTCGNIVLFRPGEVQQYTYQHTNTPELYWIHFTGSGAREYLEKAGLYEESVHYVGIHSELIESFKKIMLELQMKEKLYCESADAATLELLVLLGRKKHGADVKRHRFIDDNIRNLMERMHAEYGRRWSIDDMAGQCALSSNHFMHKFKMQTGFSAVDYIINIRMEKAKDLLLNSSLSIKEISNLVGYENSLYFSRLFCKMEGFSPREYRKKRLVVHKR